MLLHQTIIGLEAQKQLESIGEYPDIVIGCAGGGSNFAGIALPFVRDKIHGKKVHIIAAEPSSCPSITKGAYSYDFGDTAETTPLLAMYTLGHAFVPAPIHAGGLRYHGMAPIVSRLVMDNLIEARAYAQLETFAAGIYLCEDGRTSSLPLRQTTQSPASLKRQKRLKKKARKRSSS